MPEKRLVVPLGWTVVGACAAALLTGIATAAVVSRGEAEVMAADEAMAAAVARSDRAAFRGALSDNALFLGGGVTRGRDAVVESWSAVLDPSSGTSLRWRPTDVRVAGSSDLAYTVGEYVVTRTGADGESRSAKGVYVTVWGRGADGRWRVLVDAGSPPEPDDGP